MNDLLDDLAIEDRLCVLLYRKQARFGRYILLGSTVAFCVALLVAKLLLD